MLFNVTVFVPTHNARELRYIVEAASRDDAVAYAKAEATLLVMSPIQGTRCERVDGRAYLYDGGGA